MQIFIQWQKQLTIANMCPHYDIISIKDQYIDSISLN